MVFQKQQATSFNIHKTNIKHNKILNNKKNFKINLDRNQVIRILKSTNKIKLQIIMIWKINLFKVILKPMIKEKYHIIKTIVPLVILIYLNMEIIIRNLKILINHKEVNHWMTIKVKYIDNNKIHMDRNSRSRKTKLLSNKLLII
jgi:hypothetical protein